MQNSSESSFKESPEIFFKASGNEPFWRLEISEKQTVVKTLTDSIIAPYIDTIRAADHNVKLYETQIESGLLNIQIIQNKCTNSMSGNVSPYSVNVEYRKGSESKLQKFVGCGQYITDYRLNDIWVLEILNGNKADKKDFNNELPSMEINTGANSFPGFAG